MRSLFTTAFILPGLFVSAQNDTIVCYDVKTQTVTLIPPVSYDTSVIADHTGWNHGLAPGIASLSTVPPTTNLFPGVDFCDIEQAGLFHNLSDYPVRTAVSIRYYHNDTLSGGCSGIMVSNNFVLTAAHCIKMPFSSGWTGDSILVAPAFDDGLFHPSFPPSIVKKYYLFKNFYDGYFSRDLALLELEEPIGNYTGWIGMAFNTDDGFFTGKVFHKLSYPASAHPYDPTLIYNGDTMYYNYGGIEADGPDKLIVNSTGAYGIPGQSGSSIFFTDNDTAWYSYGPLVFSNQYHHYRISPATFYNFRQVLEAHTAGITEASLPPHLLVYPNPFTQSATIRFNNQNSRPVFFSLCNAQGKIVQQISHFTGNELTIPRGNLSEGIYFYALNGEGIHFSGKIIVK